MTFNAASLLVPSAAHHPFIGTSARQQLACITYSCIDTTSHRISVRLNSDPEIRSAWILAALLLKELCEMQTLFGKQNDNSNNNE